MNDPKTFLYLRRFFIGLFVVCISLLSVSAWSGYNKKSTIVSQESATLTSRPQKYVGKHMSFQNEPIEIADIRVKGKPVEINSKVREGSDWLSGLTFKVRNRSAKSIVYLSLQLLFPETRNSKDEPVMAFPLQWGADPRMSKQGSELRTLSPNDETEFLISAAQHESLKRFLEKKTALWNINAVNIDVVMVIFNDDTGWATGSYLQRDPNNPKRWLDVN